MRIIGTCTIRHYSTIKCTFFPSCSVPRAKERKKTRSIMPLPRRRPVLCSVVMYANQDPMVSSVVATVFDSLQLIKAN